MSSYLGRSILVAITISVSFLFSLAPAQENSKERSVKNQAKQRYFLIDHSKGKAPSDRSKLLLVLPGGDGSADFNPFVTNIAKHATGQDWLVAQLIAVKWTPQQRIVWPTANSKVEKMEFTTEDFIKAVIKDVAAENRIDKEHIYTLTWSSSGPAAYAASLVLDEIRGSFIAMSVFKPAMLPDLSKGKGHRYLIYHSPGDKICPFRMAKDAGKQLAKAGAEVKFLTYQGGHGWHGDLFGNIQAGLQWLASIK